MKYRDIPILMYHDVELTHEGSPQNPWVVPRAHFEAQMSFLHQEGYRTISLTQLQEGLRKDPTGNLEFSGKAVVLTFDDARGGVYTHAYPVMKRFGFTGTVFVVPSWIEGKEIPFNENYSSFLSWEELRELVSQGFEVGSHSYTHRNLVSLSQDEIEEELSRADEVLRQRLSVSISHFSYPYGGVNSLVRSVVASRYGQHGAAVTTSFGFGRQAQLYARQWVTADLLLESFQKLLCPWMLSVCMIVKDEERFLSQCLEAVRGIADELIIVDTGSRDGTKEIARRFTDKVYDYSWQDDFAAARNESLKYATGDWVFIVDADEVISPEDGERLREAIQVPGVGGYRILTRNYSPLSTVSGWRPCLPEEIQVRGFPGWFPSLKVRLFSRHPGVRFEGRVHEMVDSAIARGGGKILRLPAVAVHHYGALKGDSSQKRELYLSMMKEKVAENPEDAKAYFELGVQYKELGELDLAEEALLHSISLGSASSSVMPLLNLAIIRQKKGDIDGAIGFYTEVLEKDDHQAEAYFGLGFCAFRKNDLAASCRNFERAVALNPAYVEAYVNLGAVCERQGEYTRALTFLAKAVQLSPTHARAHYNIGVAFEKGGNLENATEYYRRCLKLGYPNQEEVQRRLNAIHAFLEKDKGGA